jgi:hypothetical protein
LSGLWRIDGRKRRDQILGLAAVLIRLEILP